MIPGDNDDTVAFDGRSVSHRDQLTYRTTLQFLANQCLRSRTITEIEINTEAFQISLYFNVPGLPFRDEIDNYLPTLEILTDNYVAKQITDLKKKDPGHPFYNPKNWDDLKRQDRSIIHRRERMFYAQNLLIFLINLLARYEALMKAKGLVEEGYELGPQIKK